MIKIFLFKKNLLIALLLALPAIALAQNSVTVDVPKGDTSRRAPAVVRYDSSDVNVRSFKKSDIEKFLKDDDFLYDRKPPVTSIWDIIREWLSQWFFKASQQKGFGKFWEILVYILIAGTLIYVNRELAKSTLKGLFYKSKKEIAFKSGTENIHEMDLENLIEKSYYEKNYALAVRYLYLQLLKDMNARGFIQWRIDKTDEDYVREVKDEVLKRGFKDLTLLFEYVWYGEFPLDEDVFKNIRTRFTDFKARMPQRV
jgi:hypothetical protein